MSKLNQGPPRWADRFLEWFCHPDLLEEIQGDVYELFDLRVQEKGAKMARRHFIWDVFRSFRLSTIRNFETYLSTAMFKSNFKIAYRQMSKQKLFSIIKIGGFALGIAACLLIALFVNDELSYDQHYKNKDRIYRLVGEIDFDGSPQRVVWFPAPMASTLQKDYPEVEAVSRLRPGTSFESGSNQIRRTDQKRNAYEEGFVYADPSFLELMEVKMVQGDLKSALSQPRSIVISKSKADKFFPDENPIGKSMILNDDPESTLTIGGVMADFPRNSHLPFNFLITLNRLEVFPGDTTNWLANNYHTYLRLHQDVDVESLEKRMDAIVENYLIPAREASGFPNAKDVKSKFELQPVTDIYLKSTDIYDLLPHGDLRLVWLFSAVAMFILLLACINFVNLSTAKSANRAKEVGLRKVVGSRRGQLISQFLTESIFLSILAFILGVILAEIMLPYFNTMADKSMVLPWQNWWLIPLLLIAAIIIGTIAGLYPSFYLSAFKPAEVLKGSLSSGSKNSKTRNMLVVFQFTTTIVLLIGTFIIYQQLEFILNKKLGFEKDQVVVLKGTNTLGEKNQTFKKELLKLPEVNAVTISDYLPIGGTLRNSNGFTRKGRGQEDAKVYGQIWRVDHDYVETLGMEMLEGRDFAVEMPTDSQAVIINEAMVKKMGLENPIGAEITNGGPNWKVIGVVKDFHFESLKDDIMGLCLVIGNSPASISLKIKTDQMSSTVKKLTKVWKQFSPNQPIRYTFLDESFKTMYADVQRTRSIFTTFALLAIIIACLGLFALSAYMAEQRSKEISIRKVLGASTANILQLLTSNFIKLVLIALLIASPIAWFGMEQWLNDFAYRVEITWGVFVLAGICALLIALLTISFQAYRSAQMEPVDALRS